MVLYFERWGGWLGGVRMWAKKGHVALFSIITVGCYELNRVRLLVKMKGAVFSSWSLPSLTSVKTRNIVTQNCCPLNVRKSCDLWVKSAVTTSTRRRRIRVGVPVSDVTTELLDPAPLEVTWQIVVGTIGNNITCIPFGVYFISLLLLLQVIWGFNIIFMCVVLFCEFCSWSYTFCGGRDRI